MLKMAAASGHMRRLQDFKSWVLLTLENTSLVIRSTLLSIVVLYLFGLIRILYNLLAVTPGFLIPPNFRIWTLVTGGLIERSIVYKVGEALQKSKESGAGHLFPKELSEVVIDVGVLLICGRQLEPLWGALELLKFIGILDICSSICTTVLCLFAYLATKDLQIWFATFSGMAGIIGGISVAFKQVMPDHKIDLVITEIRVEIIPSLLLFTSCVFAAVGVLPLTNPLQFFSGIAIGWIYLRFYQPRGRGIKGDMSDHFSFASFFPASVRPVIEKISVIVYNMLVRCGVCKTPVRTYDVGAPSAITISLPGMSPSDAERRRRKALRALNERLKKEQESRGPTTDENWPSVDDEAAKDDVETNGVIIDLENNSSSDADVEVIDKNEIEEK